MKLIIPTETPLEHGGSVIAFQSSTNKGQTVVRVVTNDLELGTLADTREQGIQEIADYLEIVVRDLRKMWRTI